MSFDLIMSVVGFVLIVGTIILILNASNLSSIYDYEIFKMSFHDAARALFSADPVDGILDDRGRFRNNPLDRNRFNPGIQIGKLTVKYRLNLSLTVQSQSILFSQTYGSNSVRYGDDCRNSNQTLSITRVVFYNNEEYKLTLTGCRLK